MRTKMILNLAIATLACWGMTAHAFNVSMEVSENNFASSNLDIQIPPVYGDSYSHQFLSTLNNWGAWHIDYAEAGGTIDYDSFVAGPGNYAAGEFLVGYNADFNIPVNPNPASYSLGVANISARFTIDVPVLYEITLDCTGQLSYAEFTLTNESTGKSVANESTTTCSGPIVQTGRLGPGTIRFFSFSNGRAGQTYAESSLRLTAVPIPTAFWLFGSALAGLGWMRRKQAN
jgi:hypothetical protein